MIRITYGIDFRTGITCFQFDNTETAKFIALEINHRSNPPFGGVELTEVGLRKMIDDLLAEPKAEYPSDYADALRYQMALQEHEELEQCERVEG